MHQGQDRGVMIMAFNTVGDLLDDPQLVDEGFLCDIDYGGEALTDVGPPYRFSETPAEVAGSVPELGEHNREVYLGVLGLSDGELSRLEQAGVV
jgi:crotonobetainyl-CoA:carnitine CoA-transferase CaiB-like acyl-CoA transferase